GFFAFTQVDAHTSYLVLCGSLFVMGLGMGGTMMPIMTSALKTLTNQEVARGSTLLNIVQQIGGSVGAAVMSVILTSQLNESQPIPGAVDPQSGQPITEAGLAIAVQQKPELLQAFPVDPSVIQRGLDFVAGSFATTFWVAFAIVVATLIPAAFLPRRRLVAQPLDDQDPRSATPVVVH
ncbi:MAG TPA: MFS transporter, partial [Catenuloplanes sp.]